MALVIHGQVAAARVTELQAFVAAHRITEQVFRDIDGAGLPIADIFEMDEYTIDIVVPLPDGLVLVYDTT